MRGIERDLHRMFFVAREYFGFELLLFHAVFRHRIGPPESSAVIRQRDYKPKSIAIKLNYSSPALFQFAVGTFRF